MSVTYSQAVRKQAKKGKTVTENGMVTRKSSKNDIVDFFFQVGGLRGRDPIPSFAEAFDADQDLALRVAQWARDIRGGAGERETFRKILVWLEETHAEVLLETKLLENVAEIGRWDDLLVLGKDFQVKGKVLSLIAKALLEDKNGLCAKWMPRRGHWFNTIAENLGLSLRQYRKLLVGLTKVVETQMCSKEWGAINYSHVPSVAMHRYGKAFGRNDGNRFTQFKQSVEKGEVKINSSTLYPHNVVHGIRNQTLDKQLAQLQWDALPNYVGSANILAMADVSGSMCGHTVDKSGLDAMSISIALAMYTATKNTGDFKNLFLTFSGEPEFVTIKWNQGIDKIVDKVMRSPWGMNTDINKAIQMIVDVGVKNKVPAAEMPKMLLILSDMQFDQCGNYSANKLIEKRYKDAGYEVPRIVFWNLAQRSDNGVPVKFNKEGVALVSGFSPSILNSLLSGSVEEIEKFTPEYIMMETIMIDRYNVQ